MSTKALTPGQTPGQQAATEFKPQRLPHPRQERVVLSPNHRRVHHGAVMVQAGRAINATCSGPRTHKGVTGRSPNVTPLLAPCTFAGKTAMRKAIRQMPASRRVSGKGRPRGAKDLQQAGHPHRAFRIRYPRGHHFFKVGAHPAEMGGPGAAEHDGQCIGRRLMPSAKALNAKGAEQSKKDQACQQDERDHHLRGNT
jgi:hypothetical protein